MARNWYGNQKITTEDLYTKKRITHSEVRGEYWKMAMWVLAAAIYLYFIFN